MKANFASALKLVLLDEGGYVNNPRDPGGATNKGITFRTYNAWRKNAGKKPQDVRKITDAEVAAIYQEQYATTVRFDDLPSGVDYCVFDYAVNSGAGRAIKELQKVVGSVPDSQIGANTIAAVQKIPAATTIDKLCDSRLAFLKRLSTWGTFGDGWSARVARVRAHALAMAKSPTAAKTVVPAVAVETTPKADPADMALTQRPGVQGGTLATVGLVGSSASDAASKLSPFIEISTIIKYVFLALMIVGVLLTMYALVKSSREVET